MYNYQLHQIFRLDKSGSLTCMFKPDGDTLYLNIENYVRRMKRRIKKPHLFRYEMRCKSGHRMRNLVDSESDRKKRLLLFSVHRVRFVKLCNRDDHVTLVSGCSRYLDVKLWVHCGRLCNVTETENRKLIGNIYGWMNSKGENNRISSPNVKFNIKYLKESYV